MHAWRSISPMAGCRKVSSAPWSCWIAYACYWCANEVPGASILPAKWRPDGGRRDEVDAGRQRKSRLSKSLPAGKQARRLAIGKLEIRTNKKCQPANEWQFSTAKHFPIEPAYYFDFFFRSAQHSFIISEMRLRAAALMWRRFGADLLPTGLQI